MFTGVFILLGCLVGCSDVDDNSVGIPQKKLTVVTIDTTNSTGDYIIKINDITFKMKYVEGGTFEMGTAEKSETPAHKVNFKYDFRLGETEVTEALWDEIMDKKFRLIKEGDCYPVQYVTWMECNEFIRRLNKLTGLKFRMPSEAEWEYAARGGNKSHGYTYAGSNDIDEVAWFRDGHAHPVGTKKANELGLYDMTGNVWEFCADYYHDDYVGAPTDGSAWDVRPKDSMYEDRVIRGGGYAILEEYIERTILYHCRTTWRAEEEVNSTSSVGLRLCL